MVNSLAIVCTDRLLGRGDLPGDCDQAPLLRFGLKVFMDAHDTVTVEEWGSLPPKAAKFPTPRRNRGV